MKVVIDGVEYVPRAEVPELTDERLKQCESLCFLGGIQRKRIEVTERKLICIDLETTGVDPETDRMSVYLEGGFFNDSISCFSNPDCNTSVILGGRQFLIISEDINWYDRGRVDQACEKRKDFFNEIYFLDMSIGF